MIAHVASTSLKKAKANATKDSLFPLENAFLTLRKPDDVTRFLLDLCTPAEINAFRERWEIAQLVDQGLSYREVAVITGASTTTVTRVARFLQLERHCGYRRALEELGDGKK
ncbi:MAG: helix-turn-helix domain-containing protein [Alphaproteobacteria bacterium]|nr:MAG: helix-turn-helix domain-containing protein [Alphaproteobacteria bacterium]